ncbi:Uncharacterised protein [Mycobacteroides abscessus subsp. abscessus]|nr:Uncharacterised protein [Mycobacteroides abscessus subsp. abscessus]
MPGMCPAGSCPSGIKGWFHCLSHPVKVSISGCCAVSMFFARSSTAGLAVRPSVSFDISTACWWCMIICCANVTSASLWSDTGAAALVSSVVVMPDMPE